MKKSFRLILFSLICWGHLLTGQAYSGKSEQASPDEQWSLLQEKIIYYKAQGQPAKCQKYEERLQKLLENAQQAFQNTSPSEGEAFLRNALFQRNYEEALSRFSLDVRPDPSSYSSCTADAFSKREEKIKAIAAPLQASRDVPDLSEEHFQSFKKDVEKIDSLYKESRYFCKGDLHALHQEATWVLEKRELTKLPQLLVNLLDCQSVLAQNYHTAAEFYWQITEEGDQYPILLGTAQDHYERWVKALEYKLNEIHLLGSKVTREILRDVALFADRASDEIENTAQKHYYITLALDYTLQQLSLNPEEEVDNDDLKKAYDLTWRTAQFLPPQDRTPYYQKCEIYCVRQLSQAQCPYSQSEVYGGLGSAQVFLGKRALAKENFEKSLEDYFKTTDGEEKRLLEKAQRHYGRKTLLLMRDILGQDSHYSTWLAELGELEGETSSSMILL